MRILAVIPAFNEEESLLGTVSRLTRECPAVDYLVVNDGSKDGTEQVCRENRLNHVRLPVNSGLAAAFRTGMKYALAHDYDAVVQFDADGQHLPAYILPMAEALREQGADIVIGSRALAGGSPEGLRQVGSRLITGLIRLTTGVTITDPTSGMRMYGRSMIEHFAHDFDMQPEPDVVALMARRGRKVVEVPAQMQERQAGESYLNLGNSVKYMLRTCLSILLFQWFR